MKNLISFSLYGDAAKYSWGALENVRLATSIYPGWDVRFYCEQNHYAIPALRRAGAQVVEMPPAEGHESMFWRFLAFDDTNYDHVLIRDADSRLNVREKGCVDQWLASGKKCHVIRDHPWMETKPLMGGTTGIMPGTINFEEEIKRWPYKSFYANDEDFLANIIWPVFKDDCMRHTFRRLEPMDIPIPPHAPYKGFVGERISPVVSLDCPAYVLSPPHYEKRRQEFFENWNNKTGIKRIDWVKGHTPQTCIRPDHYPSYGGSLHYYYITRDYIELLERLLLAGCNYAFTFEDDAMPDPEFDEYFARAWVALPEDWLALHLGTKSSSYNCHSEAMPNAPNALRLMKGSLEMRGILWNRAGMLIAYNHFTHWHQAIVDQAFSDMQVHYGGVYGPARWIVWVNPKSQQFGTDV